MKLSTKFFIFNNKNIFLGIFFLHSNPVIYIICLEMCLELKKCP